LGAILEAIGSNPERLEAILDATEAIAQPLEAKQILKRWLSQLISQLLTHRNLEAILEAIHKSFEATQILQTITSNLGRAPLSHSHTGSYWKP
jgi:hypothetical protein